MRIEIGYGPTIYGAVASTAHGLTITAENVEGRRRIENILRNMRRRGQSDADLLASLPRQLDHMLWAREMAQED